MAIGWLLSYVFMKDKNVFYNYMKKSKLNSNVKKITVRKILDSRNVSLCDKEKVKTDCQF